MATIKKEVSCKVEKDSSSPAKKSICEICKICFPNEDLLISHVCVQVKKEMVICKVCQICFPADEIMPDQQAGETEYVCETCLTNENSPTGHYDEICTGDQSLKKEMVICKVCQICFTADEIMPFQQPGETEYVCETCLINENSPTGHYDEICTGDQSFACEVCGKGFIKEISLKSHYKCHKRENLYRCGSCPKAYVHQEELEKHCLTHTNQKPFKCEFCEKAFKNNASLKSHYSSHIKGKQFFCKWCNKGFKLKSSLQNHLISHASKISQDNVGKSVAKSDENKDEQEVLPLLPDKLFRCVECNKCFGSKLFLESHIQSHADKNSFMCNICKKTFKQSIGLKIHYRYHTREKPYKCHYCDKKFYDTSDRKYHILLHHKDTKPVL